MEFESLETVNQQLLPTGYDTAIMVMQSGLYLAICFRAEYENVMGDDRKAPRGVGSGEGVSPSSVARPPPQKVFGILCIQILHFGAF